MGEPKSSNICKISLILSISSKKKAWAHNLVIFPRIHSLGPISTHLNKKKGSAPPSYSSSHILENPQQAGLKVRRGPQKGLGEAQPEPQGSEGHFSLKIHARARFH